MKKVSLVIFFVFAFMLIAFGYAQITDELKIDGSASLTAPKYELQITSVMPSENNAADVTVDSMVFHGTVINSTVTLSQTGSSMLLIELL